MRSCHLESISKWKGPQPTKSWLCIHLHLVAWKRTKTGLLSGQRLRAAICISEVVQTIGSTYALHQRCWPNPSKTQDIVDSRRINNSGSSRSDFFSFPTTYNRQAQANLTPDLQTWVLTFSLCLLKYLEYLFGCFLNMLVRHAQQFSNQSWYEKSERQKICQIKVRRSE